MKKLIVFIAFTVVFTGGSLNKAFGAPDEIIEKNREIRQSLKQLHNKPFSDLEDYLKKNFNVSAPFKTSGRSARYMLPIKDPWCIKVNVMKHYKKDILASWETTPWFRNNPNSLAEECDKAFREQ